MKDKYKLALLSGPIFSNNMGCNALTYGSLNILSEVANKLNVVFEYYLLGNPMTGVIPPEIQAHKINLIEQLPDFSFKGILRCIYRHNYKDIKYCADALKEVDIFLDNAWGDSFSDIYGEDRFNTVSSKLKFALKTGKPLILLPQTIGPFRANRVRKKAGKLLGLASLVYARDPLSVECAKDTFHGLEVFETIDAAFFMNYKKVRISDKKDIVVGINPSGLLWQGGYTGDNQFNLKDDYKKVITEVVKYLLSLDGISIVLIGHDIKGPNAGNLMEDYYVCKIIQREFPACKVGPFFYSPVEAKSYISGLDLLIGSRMHCCIAAYSSGVPVYPLAYSRKFKGLFSDKLDYQHLSELTQDTCESVIVGINNLLSQLEDIKAEMPSRMQVLESYKRELIEDLSLKLSKLMQVK